LIEDWLGIDVENAITPEGPISISQKEGIMSIVV
jgi:hypothetical protein